MPQEEPEVISLEELQAVLEKVLDHIRVERGVTLVPLKSDYYWNIDLSHAFDMSRHIGESSIDVGSLRGDWDAVKRSVLIEGQPLAINLAMISTLLRYVGMTVADLTASVGG